MFLLTQIEVREKFSARSTTQVCCPLHHHISLSSKSLILIFAPDTHAVGQSKVSIRPDRLFVSERRDLMHNRSDVVKTRVKLFFLFRKTRDCNSTA